MGWCSKEIFLQKLEEFQIIYELKYEMEGNHKYRQFYAHIPNRGLVPNSVFQRVPNFNKLLETE